MEASAEAGQDGAEQDICDERHGRDVHIGRIEVVTRREKDRGIMLLLDLTLWARRRSHPGLLSRPGLVTPWEEHKGEFAQDVCV